MSNKVLITLAPLLVTAALAVLPAATQATEPCYTKNSKLCSSVKETQVEVYGWGTLAFMGLGGPAGATTCHTATAGTVLNGPTSGVGQTVLYSTYDCTYSGCPDFTTVKGEHLPWTTNLEFSELPVAGTIRQKSSGIRIDYQCWGSKADEEAGTEKFGSLAAIGSYQPKLNNKPSAKSPPTIEFDPNSGTLESEGGTVQVYKTEGHLSTLGYNEQEIINAVHGPTS
jgi:hypothetical protein